MTDNTALRNSICDAIAAIFDGGTLEIQKSDNTVLASITLPSPAFGAASSGVAAKAGTWVDSSNNATGTADHAVLKDSGGTKTRTLTVGVGSGECQLSTLSIVSGGSTTVSACSLSQPAS